MDGGKSSPKMPQAASPTPTRDLSDVFRQHFLQHQMHLTEIAIKPQKMSFSMRFIANAYRKKTSIFQWLSKQTSAQSQTLPNNLEWPDTNVRLSAIRIKK